MAFLLTAMEGKEPFDIDEVFARLRRVAAGLPKAAMFELRDRGYNSAFEQLVAFAGKIVDSKKREVDFLFQISRFSLFFWSMKVLTGLLELAISDLV